MSIHDPLLLRAHSSLPPRRSPRLAPAFTMAESVMAMAVLAILMLGMAGALGISVRAADRGDDAPARSLAAASALDDLSADLADATAITESSPNAIAFTVPDRTGDALPDTIRYEWTATRAGTLTRAVNNKTPVPIASNVDGFSVTFRDRVGDASSESAEQPIFQVNSLLSGLTASSTSIDEQRWARQHVAPAWDSSVLAWSVTRLRLVATKHGNGAGQFVVRILKLPGGSVANPIEVFRTRIDEATLPSANSTTFTDIPMLPITGLAPTDELNITIEGFDTTGKDCSIAFLTGSGLPFNTYFTTSSNGGVSWTSPSDNQDMMFELYGTVTTRR